MKTILKVCVLALGVTGCAVRGPSPVVSAKGIEAPTGSGGTTEVFRQAFDEAYKNVNSPNSTLTAAHMVRVGAELQYQLCKDFFRSAGKDQQWLLFGKDFLAVAGTIATGVLGAASVASGNAANATAIAWTGLATAAGVSTINLYARNFLFSEENVGAVQKLTLDAVSAARSAALSEERLATYDFASGISALIDVQSQCEVQNILNLVRDSIGLARPYVVPDFNTAAGGMVLAKLSSLVNNGRPITSNQLQYLYWLLMLSPTDEERGKIYKELKSLFIPPTLANDTANPQFTALEYEIRKALGALPESVKDDIVKSVAAAKPQKGPYSLSSITLPAGSSSLGRIRVEVK